MKDLLVKLTFVVIAFNLNAQENINDLLAAGIQDAEHFTTDYI